MAGPYSGGPTDRCWRIVRRRSSTRWRVSSAARWLVAAMRNATIILAAAPMARVDPLEGNPAIHWFLVVRMCRPTLVPRP